MRHPGRAISRTVAAVIVVIIVIIGIAGVYATLSHPATTSSTISTSTVPPSTSISSLVSTSSASSATSSSSSTASSGTLTIDDSAFPGEGGNVLNTITGHTVPDWGESAVYQTLVVLNVTAEQKFGQQQYLPDLAVNWTVSPNQTVYTFNLRQGVKFSNGDPFNSYAAWAEFYFWYYISANASNFWLGLPIFNTTAINYGQATFSLINRSGLASPSHQLLSIMSNQSWPAYVTSPSTIVFKLNSPFPFFLSTLLNTVGWMWDPSYFAQHEGISTPGAVEAVSSFFNTNSVPGTGPYVETSIQTNAYIIFHKNPTYWGSNLTSAQIAANPVLDPGHYSTILVQYKPDDVARYTDVTSGAVQMAAVLTSNLDLVLNNPTYKIATENYSATANFLVFNTQIFPTNITLVRQAIVHAINYSAIIQEAVDGYGQQFVGPETPNYGKYYDPGNLPPYSFNLTLASNDLAKAGYKNGTGLPPLQFDIDQFGVAWQEPAAEIIQADLAQIGINVQITILTDANFYSFYNSYSAEAASPTGEGPLRFDDPFGYAPDYVAPTDYWVGFVTNSSYYGNDAIYNNPIVDQAVNALVTSTNTTYVLQQLAIAQQQIYNDAPYAWLFVAQLPLVDGSYAYNKNVIGGFYMDFALGGITDVPLLNTIYPASG